jgi:NADH-ubiquinone/plastoquinone oxidoreductase chain 6
MQNLRAELKARGSKDLLEKGEIGIIPALEAALEARNMRDLSKHIADEISLSRNSRRDEIERSLRELEEIARTARNRAGMIQFQLEYRPESPPPLSSFSGPPPFLQYKQSETLREVRRDAEGRPAVPADNATYLGRSLFTDYLLPVELGGLLLLVATVGAIVITHRRPEKERPA